MYKIYVNEIPVLLVSSDSAAQYLPAGATHLVFPYMGKLAALQSVFAICDAPGPVRSIVLYASDPDLILRDIRSSIKELPAAGGIVFNELNEVLFIYRRGYWDLPKGKVDPGESLEQTAIREVQEETGITGVRIVYELCDTFHIYKTLRNNRFLKKSTWFIMSTKKQPLRIQREEGIEEALWITIPTFIAKCKPVYNNILDVLETFNAKGIDWDK